MCTDNESLGYSSLVKSKVTPLYVQCTYVRTYVCIEIRKLQYLQKGIDVTNSWYVLRDERFQLKVQLNVLWLESGDVLEQLLYFSTNNKVVKL